jgi:hypothetical protein
MTHMSNHGRSSTILAKSSLFVIAGLGLMAAIACSSSDSGTTTTPAPLAGEVVSPISGDKVHASLASATLGDQTCTKIETASIHLLSCAAIPDGGARGTGPCGGPCRATTIVFELKADPGAGTSHIAVTGVSLVSATGAPLASLSASTPESWDDASGAYRAWDQTLAAGTTVKARYTVSPPPWSTIDHSSKTAQYRLQVTVEVDGAKIQLSTEPMAYVETSTAPT